MSKLPEVEQAKALMTEAMSWSVMKWLREKKRVRRTADEANAALDELDRAVKARWTHELKTAYSSLAEKAAGNARRSLGAAKSRTATEPEIVQIAWRIKQADDEAEHARVDAEHTFDEAERTLSTSLAREGCQKAIKSWELREAAIRRAELSS